MIVTTSKKNAKLCNDLFATSFQNSNKRTSHHQLQKIQRHNRQTKYCWLVERFAVSYQNSFPEINVGFSEAKSIFRQELACTQGHTHVREWATRPGSPRRTSQCPPPPLRAGTLLLSSTPRARKSEPLGACIRNLQFARKVGVPDFWERACYYRAAAARSTHQTITAGLLPTAGACPGD
jgi:hypothetical protein